MCLTDVYTLRDDQIASERQRLTDKLVRGEATQEERDQIQQLNWEYSRRLHPPSDTRQARPPRRALRVSAS